VPLQWGGFVVLTLAASAFDVARSTQSERAAEGVHLTLSSHTVWQDEYGWCTFSAQIVQGRLFPRAAAVPDPSGLHLPVLAVEVNADVPRLFVTVSRVLDTVDRETSARFKC
jgi:hypothetical protein